MELVGQRVHHRHPADRRPSPRSGPGRRCARRSPRTAGPAPGSVSSTGSPRPSWLDCGVDHQRVAAELGDADRERHPGAGRRLVEHARPPPAARPAAGGRTGRPSSGRRGRAPRPARPGLRSSSRRKCRVTGRPSVGAVAGLRRAVAASRIAGSAATNASACASVRTSGGTSRTTSGATALTRKPALAGGRLDRRRDRRGQHDAEQQPGAADGRRPAGGRAPVMPVGERLAQRPRRARAGRPARWCRARRARRRRRPGCRRTWCRARPGTSSVGRVAEGQAGADRQAAAEPLGQGDDVGLDARATGGRTRRRCGRSRSAPRRARAARRAAG